MAFFQNVRLSTVKLAFSEISCIYLGEIEQGNIFGFFLDKYVGK